ncbi:MAG: hypothetical protein J0J15_07215, partial [Mesorhizobium sp.]|nr:hypothetical protein [Mesorhizobium sp.]
VDVCLKDPGYPTDVIVTGPIAVLIDIYLGHQSWRKATRERLRVDGDAALSRQLEKWLRLDRIVGRDLPIVPPGSALS